MAFSAMMGRGFIYSTGSKCLSMSASCVLRLVLMVDFSLLATPRANPGFQAAIDSYFSPHSALTSPILSLHISVIISPPFKSWECQGARDASVSICL
jgi:hypothetical protein